jgi:hypothetical protein
VEARRLNDSDNRHNSLSDRHVCHGGSKLRFRVRGCLDSESGSGLPSAGHGSRGPGLSGTGHGP